MHASAANTAAAADAIGLRPHDLLSLHGPCIDPLPAWADPVSPVVVRRDDGGTLIPVGLRGAHRSQRMASWTTADNIADVITPERLGGERRWRGHRQSALPSLVTLEALARRLDDLALPWGPTGSAGFAVATGMAILRSESDLDLCIRATVALDRQQAAHLRGLAQAARCRLDIQIETPFGGFALDEWMTGRGSVLLKTRRAPLMVADPWSDPWSDPWRAPATGRAPL